jgi:signal transduction histidine kinase
LTSIIGYADLLLRKETPIETRQKWLKNILENSQKITDMVDDLLNISRIQSGKINLKISEVNFSDIVSERLPFFMESSSKHSFVVNLPSNLPTLLADRDKVWQIIGNLLSNAIKYSPNGGNITISAQYEAEKYRVIISVRDEGMGISPEDGKTLFKTFHRVQRPETRGIRGSGLGLYIVKEWAEAMGGEVWLESALNQGSTFFVSIPTRRDMSA